MIPEGILFYGIAYKREDLGDEEDWYDKVEEYFDRCRDRDCPEPYPEYDKKQDDPKVNPEYARKWSKWRKDIKKWEPGQVNMGFRGSGDYSEPYLYVIGSRTRVEWDEVEEVSTKNLGAADWDEKLKEYCKAAGLPFRKPKWLLAAYYG